MQSRTRRVHTHQTAPPRKHTLRNPLHFNTHCHACLIHPLLQRADEKHSPKRSAVKTVCEQVFPFVLIGHDGWSLKSVNIFLLPTQNVSSNTRSMPASRASAGSQLASGTLRLFFSSFLLFFFSSAIICSGMLHDLFIFHTRRLPRGRKHNLWTPAASTSAKCFSRLNLFINESSLGFLYRGVFEPRVLGALPVVRPLSLSPTQSARS